MFNFILESIADFSVFANLRTVWGIVEISVTQMLLVLTTVITVN